MDRLSGASESGSWSQNCGYDRYGNRAVSASTGTTLNPLTPTSLAQYNTSNNRLTANGYDLAGNLTQEGSGRAFTYDAENRQLTFNGTAGRYTYEGNGRRVKKIDGAGTTVMVYDAAGRLIAEYASGGAAGNETSYVTSDALDSTRVVTDSNGAVKARYDYLPFGEELGAGIGQWTGAIGYSGSDTIRQKYTGKERDNGSGLDYFLARYYSSPQGRFTSADPLITSGKVNDPQSWNRYTYTLDNPMVLIDPDGLEWRTNDKTGTIRWYSQGEDRAGTTEYTREYYKVGDSWLHLNRNGYTNNPSDSTFDRQGWDYVDASQVPGFYNPDNEPKISAAPGDNTSWLGLTWEFFTGTGPVERQPGPDSAMTKGLMTSPDIPHHRQNFIDQGGGTYGPTGYRFGTPSSADGPVTSATHMSREFVGSYTITITEQSNGDALFVLQNTTSLPSLLYHAPGI